MLLSTPLAVFEQLVCGVPPAVFERRVCGVPFFSVWGHWALVGIGHRVQQISFRKPNVILGSPVRSE